ncbi:hypothetical protein GY21_18965 [Cryobacterium roopkundense]|uniref:Uncharacterized protein n=1 Tax=Cryobacterium roopkundense TaxID=1001240 RepID=A0A099J2Y4_9MICO|nr:hypothetical protein [Cryobacterium roopkundense]KGJ71902.1 hypothetical protein GY21_18965 [Cryobacterium roopkundense]MBB5641780.1 hypothetical protein [Cryobacterium roopkundense]
MPNNHSSQPNQKPTISADPEATFVSIYCLDVSHDGEKVPVRTFRPFGVTEIDGEQVVQWAESRPGYQSNASDTLAPLKGHATQFLRGNEYLPEVSAQQSPEGVERSRISLVCPRHSAPRLVRRAEALDPIFSKLAQFRISEIELGLFIRRVGK